MATRKLLFGLVFAGLCVGFCGGGKLVAEDSLGIRKQKATQRYYELFYSKIKKDFDTGTGKFTVEQIQRASLVCFQNKLAAARTESEFTQAATEHVEREGFAVTKIEN